VTNIEIEEPQRRRASVGLSMLGTNSIMDENTPGRECHGAEEIGEVIRVGGPVKAP
jgi:hypothetical protein